MASAYNVSEDTLFDRAMKLYDWLKKHPGGPHSNRDLGAALGIGATSVTPYKTRLKEIAIDDPLFEDRGRGGVYYDDKDRPPQSRTKEYYREQKSKRKEKEADIDIQLLHADKEFILFWYRGKHWAARPLERPEH